MRTALLWVMVVAGAQAAGCDDFGNPPCPVQDDEDPDCEEDSGDSGGSQGPYYVPLSLLFVGTNASAWAGHDAVIQLFDQRDLYVPTHCLRTVVSSAGTFAVESYAEYDLYAPYGAFVVLHGDSGNDYDAEVDSSWFLPVPPLGWSDVELRVDASDPEYALPVDDVCDAAF